MRIFSKFHDYYDKALSYGIDPNVIFERREEDITELVKKQYGLENKVQKIHDDVFDFRVERINSPELKVESKTIVLFCGRIYLCIKIGYKIKDYPLEKYVTEFIYTFDAFEKAITLHSKINLGHNIPSNIFDGLMTITRRFKMLFDKQGMVSSTATDLHFELDAPIIVFDYDLIYTYSKKIKVYKNRCLKNMEFYKIVDPFTAFQELSMFVGGVMGGKSPSIIEVADKDRVAKHGFDKFSFRKDKKE